MKVVDFINKLQDLTYTEDTELIFGFLNNDEGAYYECEIETIDDEDRSVGCDDIAITFKKPKNYIKSEVETANMNFREELLNVVNRYV